MDYFKFCKASSLFKNIEVNDFGEKFGEGIVTIPDLNHLETSNAKYVIFGVPTVSHTKYSFSLKPIKFEALLKDLLNTQNNQFNKAEDLIILGEINMRPIDLEIDINKQILESSKKEITEIYNKLENIIFELTTAIFKSGKIPIMLGGNLSNSISMAKSLRSFLDKTINLFDLSPNSNFNLSKKHITLSPTNYFDTDLFRKYFAFGLHKNYIPQKNLDQMSTSKQIDFNFYEDCLHLTTLDKCVKFKNSIDFLNGSLGFRLDLKSIQGLSLSCESSSGFSERDIRTFIKVIKKEKVEFIHLCGFETCKKENVGGILSYLISDFMRHEE